jgi:cell division protein FtsW
MRFNRQNKNSITSWWWTVDKLSLLAIIILIVFGAFMVTTASVAIADRIGHDIFYFVKKQLIFLSGTLIIIVGISFMTPMAIRRMAIIGFLCGLILMVAVLVFGSDINGAKRWIFIAGQSLQPSEFMKPFFVVVTAWMLSEAKIKPRCKGFRISFMLYLVLSLLLLSQPDFGMFVVVSSVWGAQLFIAGLPLYITGLIFLVGIFVLVSAYLLFPHVAYRLDSFINAKTGGNYQVNKSLEAFNNGGLLGRGPGEGVVKEKLPDSHTDFIFAVIGEELGAIVCIFVIGLYAFIVIRGLKKMLEENDLFYVYAVSGLLMQFGIQASINIGVSMNLLPTKGMTLPFISYGGSSMFAIAISMGMMLALTKKRFGNLAQKRKIVWENT